MHNIWEYISWQTTFIKMFKISEASNTLKNPKIVLTFFDETIVLYGNDVSFRAIITAAFFWM